MSWHEQLMQMVNQTQWWVDLSPKKQAALEGYLTWARKTIRTKEGCNWIARIFRRAAIYLSMDPAGEKEGKWFRARQDLNKQGYTMSQCIDEICAIVTLSANPAGGKPTSQLAAVFDNFRAKTVQLDAMNIDVDKLNPRVVRRLMGGQGDGHSADCPSTGGGHCKCGWREIERRAMELAPLRQAICTQWGIDKLEWTTADGRDRSFHQVYDDVNKIGSQNDAMDKLPEGKVIVKVSNEARWVALDKHGDEYEGKLLGHCGNQGGDRSDTLLSLRVESKRFPGFFEPRLTFVITPHGILGEMKGANNQKPAQEYHKAIVALLKQPMVNGLLGQHWLPPNNFSINDLSDEDFLELYQARPDLVKRQATFGDQYQKLNSQKLELIKSLGQPGEKPAERPKAKAPVKPAEMEVEDPDAEDRPLPE